MKLYVANLTKMDHDFSYVVPGSGERRTQRIKIGEQVMVWRDDKPEVIHGIIDQHARYGLVGSHEVDGMRTFCGMCYSLDKPVAVAAMIRGIRVNEAHLAARGEQIRRESAVAAHSAFARPEVAQGGALNHVTVSIEELNDGGRAPNAGKLFNENVQVVSDGFDPDAAPPPVVARPSRRARGGSRAAA